FAIIEALVRARTAARLSQAELARKIGTTQSAIARLEGGGVSRSIWKDIRGPIYHRMEALVQAAQAAGLMTTELKPDHLIVTFMGAISFYFAYANSLEDIFQRPPLSPEMLAERKEQVMKIFHLALRKS
ncbi:helix-turn-helix domain-containing protein, partial [bacterium]